MSALAFDPCAALKRRAEKATPPKASNPPNRAPFEPSASLGLGELGGLAGVASADCKTTLAAPEPERWAAAYRRDWPPGTLEAVCEAAVRDATPERDGPPWPDPGTPERERLERANAVLCAGLLRGYERHRAVMLAGPGGADV